MIDLSKILRAPVLFKRGTTQKVMAYAEPLEFGRIMIEKTTEGKLRLIIGDGTTKPSDRNNETRYVGEHIFNANEVATVSMGNVAAGASLAGRTALEVLRDIVAPYQAVQLASLSLNKTQFEIGFPISGTLILTLGITNIANLAAGNSGTASSSPAIFTPALFDPRTPYTANVNAYSRSTPGTLSVTAQILGSRGEISSRSANISWLPPIFYGSSTLAQITSLAQLTALGGKLLSTSRARDYVFSGPGYDHIGFAVGVNVDGIGFIDNDFPTAFAMQQMPDLTYNNGYINVTLKMFRSINYFNGSTSFKVT